MNKTLLQNVNKQELKFESIKKVIEIELIRLLINCVISQYNSMFLNVTMFCKTAQHFHYHHITELCVVY